MKKVTFTIVILLCISLVFAQEKKNKVWLGYQTPYFINPSFVNGKLKEMTQISYSAKLIDGKIEKGEKIKWKYSNDNTVHARYVFSESGQLIQKVTYNDAGNFVNNTLLNYDNNNLQKLFYMQKDTLAQIHNIASENNKISLIGFNEPLTNFSYGYFKLHYDNNGYMIKKENFNPDGDKTMEINWERDNKGRIETYKSTDGEGNIIFSGYYEYDDLWEPSKMVSQYSGGKEVNNVIKMEYEFDESGNWTKQIRYRNEEPQNITFRTFKFYIDQTVIELPEDLLTKYVGKYELQADLYITIFKEGTKMYGQVSGQDKFEIFAYQKHKFFLKEAPAHLEFHFNSEELVTGLTFVQGREFQANKVE